MLIWSYIWQIQGEQESRTGLCTDSDLNPAYFSLMPEFKDMISYARIHIDWCRNFKIKEILNFLDQIKPDLPIEVGMVKYGYKQK